MDGLLGSSILAPMVTIAGSLVQLGDVVRCAFHDSGLSAAEWNDLDACRRDLLLVAAIYDLRDAAETAETA